MGNLRGGPLRTVLAAGFIGLSIWLTSFGAPINVHANQIEASSFDVSDSELRLLRAYPEKSNELRSELMTAFQLPESVEKQNKIAAINKSISEYDGSTLHIISRLINGGYWTDKSSRDPGLNLSIWLALQHVFDLKLVKITLDQLPPLVDSGEISAMQYAQMFDRLSLVESGKQKYGTQMRCQEGKWVPSPIADEKEVETLRRKIGLSETMETFIGHYVDMKCSFTPTPR